MSTTDYTKVKVNPMQPPLSMPIYLTKPWREVVAGWDEAKKTRHQTHVVRMMAAHWSEDAARYRAYVEVIREDAEAKLLGNGGGNR